jgi:ribose 5-phosphate isomerase B
VRRLSCLLPLSLGVSAAADMGSAGGLGTAAATEAAPAVAETAVAGALMYIAIASDHNGITLRNELRDTISREWIDNRWKSQETQEAYENNAFFDFGPFREGPVDYTQYADQVAHVVARGDCQRGILICGTGVGMSIVANKVKGVRAALVHNLLSAEKSREHNDANVLCLGSWVASGAANIEFARAWLAGEFGEGRHVRRVEMIEPDKNRIVLANGVFDILHPGHIAMLQWARSLGSWLVVGINSDDSASILKGPNRPINRAAERKRVLESLRFVDEVIVFDEVKATSLIEEIRPQIVVKGAEWKAHEVRERDQIPHWCDVKVFPLLDGHSTTGLISKIADIRRGAGY